MTENIICVCVVLKSITKIKHLIMNFIVLQYFVLKYIILNSLEPFSFSGYSLCKITSLSYCSEHAKMGEKLSFR